MRCRVHAVVSDRTFDRKIGGSKLGWSLKYRIVPLEKKLKSTLSHFTQMYDIYLTKNSWSNRVMN